MLVDRLDDPADALAVADRDQLDRSPSACRSGCRATWLSKIVNFICGRAPIASGQVRVDLAAGVVDVRDTAVGPVEDGLLPLEPVAVLADRLLRQGQASW